MAKVLLVHPGEVALAREVAGAVGASLRGMGHELRCTWEQRGVAGGQVSALEAAVAEVDRVLLVDPLGWWAMHDEHDERERSLRGLVDYAVHAGIDRFAVVRSGDRARVELEGSLASLPSFVLPERWAGLAEWLAQPQDRSWELPITEPPPVLPGHFVANEAAIEALDEAVAATRERGGIVWIRGAVGTGKTALLSDWLGRRASSGDETICHVARPGIAWSCDPERVLTKFVRALLGADFAGSHADALARLDAPLRSKRAIVVIDGLEQIVGALSAEQLDQWRGLFTSGIPRCVTVIATSRPLALGVLLCEPAIDLDAEPWRTQQARCVEQLVQRAGSGSENQKPTDPKPWSVLVRESAAGNLGLAAGLLDTRTGQTEVAVPPTELELPGKFSATLERSWTAMLSRAGTRSAALRSGLAMLTAAPEPLPASLFSAALLEDEREAVRGLAAEWLHETGGRVGFVHPFVRRFLAAELDPLDPMPHVRLLDALTSLHRRAALDEAAAAYDKRNAREHRLACHGFEPGLAWITDVELLVSLAEHGELVGRLEAALELADSARLELVEHVLSVARRRHAEFIEHAAALPSQLHAELVGHGIASSKVRELLRWGPLLPPIRLVNALVAPDRSVLRLGHSGDVRGCAIDAAGTRAVSVTSDRRLCIWSVRSGERVADLDIGAWAEGCAISADGKRAVVGAGQRVSLWDLDRKKALGHHDDHSADLTSVSMSTDGRVVLSTDRDGIVRLWRVERDKSTQLGRHGAIVRCGAISADGRLGITGDDDHGVVVWDLERGERIQELPGHTYGVGGVALTKGGDLAISICIGEARVWEPRSGQLLHTHDNLGMSTHGCVLVEAGEGAGGGIEALVAESGPELHRWTVTDGKPRARHFAHAQDMTSVAATPDGKWYMTGGQDHVARVWSRASMTDVSEYPHRRAITSLFVSAEPSSVWVSGGGDGTRRVSVTDGRELERISPSCALALAEVGDLVVTGGSSRCIEVVSRSRGAVLGQWESSKDWLRTCAVDPTGTRLAYAGDEKLVFCADLEGKILARFSGHGDWIRALAWLPEGRLVSADDDGELRIWDVDSKTCVRTCSMPGGSAIYALALDGPRAFVGGIAGNVASIDLDDGKTLVSFKAHESAVTDLAVVEPGTLVSVSRDATLRIWAVDDTDARMLARYDAAYPFTCVVAVEGKLVAGDAAGNHLILDVDWERLRGM